MNYSNSSNLARSKTKIGKTWMNSFCCSTLTDLLDKNYMDCFFRIRKTVLGILHSTECKLSYAILFSSPASNLTARWGIFRGNWLLIDFNDNRVFRKWNRNSLNSLNSTNSGNLINHWSMNWAKFKDPVCHMCLAGTVVASWSLTQEVAG